MALTPTQCWRILDLPRDSGLEEVKSAYRRMAFKLHPDLNPDDPQAGAKFQRLNEAYVFLSRVLADKAAQGPKAPPPPGPEPSPGPQAPPPPPPPGPETFAFHKEEVLRDILKDPFARQVFEDIYRQVKSGRLTPDKPLRRRRLSLSWGGKSVDLDLSAGVWGGIKSWASSQLDDEQTVHFPLTHLRPGRQIRVTVSRRFGEPRTLDITLPADFLPGKPIRLKGLGRKLGPLTGDLYLKVLPK